jgi:hypothetical protein
VRTLADVFNDQAWMVDHYATYVLHLESALNDIEETLSLMNPLLASNKKVKNKDKESHKEQKTLAKSIMVSALPCLHIHRKYLAKTESSILAPGRGSCFEGITWFGYLPQPAFPKAIEVSTLISESAISVSSSCNDTRRCTF